MYIYIYRYILHNPKKGMRSGPSANGSVVYGYIYIYIHTHIQLIQLYMDIYIYTHIQLIYIYIYTTEPFAEAPLLIKPYIYIYIYISPIKTH